MGRKRYRPKAGIPSRLDQPCLLFAYQQDSADWHHWRYRTVSYRKVLDLVAAKDAEPFTRRTENGIMTFWRESRPLVEVEHSPAALNAHTTVAVACAGGRLNRWERREVERYRAWNEEGDRRAPLVRRTSLR